MRLRPRPAGPGAFGVEFALDVVHGSARSGGRREVEFDAVAGGVGEEELVLARQL